MDSPSDIHWDDVVVDDDIQLDEKNLPPLNDISTTNAQLPDIDLLDLFSLDEHNSTTTSTPATATAATTVTTTNTTIITDPVGIQPHQQIPHIHHAAHTSIIDDRHCKAMYKPRVSTPPPSISPVTSASPSASPTPTPSSPSGSGLSSSSTTDGASSSDSLRSADEQKPSRSQLSDQSQLVLELSTRLSSATSEATTLRKRVGSLTQENRNLRAALDHANARLIAVAQAATNTTNPTTANSVVQQHCVPGQGQQPVMLGLAHITSDVVSRLSGALTISNPNHQPYQPITEFASPSASSNGNGRKKRKRMGAAATTMACVMFMWGALIGSPGWLSSSTSSSRTQAALPSGWRQDSLPAPTTGSSSSVELATGSGPADQWQPNCIRMLGQLPDGVNSEDIGVVDDNYDESNPRLLKKQKTERLVVVGKRKDEDEEEEEEQDYYHHGMVVKGENVVVGSNDRLEDGSQTETKNTAKLVARVDEGTPRYSYVLCRDAASALDNVQACASRMRAGQPCGEPHTISLILPAAAAGLDGNGLSNENDTDAMSDLAEVQCSITSVARIPVPSKHHESTHADSALYGKVIATVPETGTVVTDA